MLYPACKWFVLHIGIGCYVAPRGDYCSITQRGISIDHEQEVYNLCTKSWQEPYSATKAMVTTAGILYQVTEFLLEDECAETVVIVMLRCA